MAKVLIFVLFILYISSLKANVSTVNYKTLQAYGMLNNGEGYLFAFPEECTEILNTFAQYASEFTRCSILHARPIRLCEQCVNHYVQFDNKYNELLTTVVNGTSCRSLFISHDRLDTVLEYYDSISTIWDKGHCSDCFNWSEGTPKLANETKHFMTLFTNTMDCIVNHINSTLNNSEEVCEKCMQSYVQLDEYYKTLSADAIGVDSVCMDIFDSMNTTRSIWSKSLNCCRLRRTPEIIFLCCTGIISLLPFLYYIAVRFCGPIRDLPNVLRQSRFKQTILRSVEGRNN